MLSVTLSAPDARRRAYYLLDAIKEARRAEDDKARAEFIAQWVRRRRRWLWLRRWGVRLASEPDSSFVDSQLYPSYVYWRAEEAAMNLLQAVEVGRYAPIEIGSDLVRWLSPAFIDRIADRYCVP